MKENIIDCLNSKIKIKESELGAVVSIITENAKVVVNGEIVWEKYEDSNYAMIPTQMRNYIYNQNPINIELEDEQTVVDVDFKNLSDVTLYFPNNRRFLITARINLINSVKDFFDYYADTLDVERSELADREYKLFSLWNELKNCISLNNYSFVYSHSMGDKYFGWWDIKFKSADWDIDKFESCVNAIANFNKELRKVELELGVK